MSDKAKRKEKPKNNQHQQLTRYGLLTLLILGVLIVSMLNEDSNENAQAVDVASTAQCFFAWSYKNNEEMTTQIEDALAQTGLEFDLIGVVHNGEYYCDQYSVYDTTVTINVTIPRGEVTEALEAIVERLPDLDTNNAIYLQLGIWYEDGEVYNNSSYRTLYNDIRRAYAEGLRGEDLLEMGR